MENRILTPIKSNHHVKSQPFKQRHTLPQYFYPFLSPISDTVKANQISDFIDSLRTTTRFDDLASVYIHIPFCRNFCLFCPVYKTRLPDESGLNDYVNQLIREMTIYSKLKYVSHLRFGAVYVGGGSPSLLPPHLLKKLLTAVKDHFPLIDDCEITVEGEIRTLNDPNRLEALSAGGCTRISFGVQSFDTFVRRKSNLRPRIDEIETCIKRLRSFGFNVNIDLMFGLPGQTQATWKRDLVQAVELDADHIDCYDTVIYPNTKLFRLRHKYKTILADESDKMAMYTYALDFLPKQGLKQRTNAIFSKESNRFHLPSLLSSEGTYEMVAIGDSAIGYLKGTAYRNISPLSSYQAWSKDPELPIRLLHTLTREELFTKRVLSFCRLLGINKTDLDPEMMDFMRPTMNDLISRGLVEENDKEFKLNRLGRIWYDNVFLSFIPPRQRSKMWKIMY